jgi:hypothetical protein
MTPEEERFNELLARLENSNLYPLATPFAETPGNRLTYLDIEIWMMKSEEIFYQGRLRGSRKVNAGRPQYNSYTINDLETLVREVALNLSMWLQYKEYKYIDREGLTKIITDLFDRLLQAFDAVEEQVPFIRLFTETTTKEPNISAIRKVIERWEKRILKNIKPVVDEHVIKEDLAKLFITHVPDARPSRIAKCISVILSPAQFNVKVNIETFRKEIKKLKEDIEFDREY